MVESGASTTWAISSKSHIFLEAEKEYFPVGGGEAAECGAELLAGLGACHEFQRRSLRIHERARV